MSIPSSFGAPTRRSRVRSTALSLLAAATLVGASTLVATPAEAATTTTVTHEFGTATATVPSFAIAMDVVVHGGNGGNGGAGLGKNHGGPGGAGSMVTLTNVPVTPGQSITMVSGSRGSDGAHNIAFRKPGGTGGAGPVNATGGRGGSTAGAQIGTGGGGGGASVVHLAGTLIAVAGGGGGGGGGGSARPGGPGGSNSPGGSGHSAFDKAGRGGQMNPGSTASVGATGDNGWGANLEGGGGGGGGGFGGGSGGKTGKPGSGGGGAAGTSYAAPHYGTANITGGTQTPGHVVITYRYATTSATLSASTTTPSVGASVTLTATTSVDGVGVVPGTVSFSNGTILLGTAPVDAAGVATLTWTPRATGAHEFTAVFTPTQTDRYPAQTSSPLTIEASKIATQLTVGVTPTTPKAGQPVTITATVTPAILDATLVMDGLVEFVLDGTRQTAPLTVHPGGEATASVTMTPATSPLTFTASYIGNGLYASSDASGTQEIATWPTSTTGTLTESTMRSDATTTYDVSVAPIDADSPAITGSATLVVDGVKTGDAVSLVSGRASLTVPAGLTAGTHQIGAAFVGTPGIFGDSESIPSALEITAIPSDLTVSVSGPTHTGLAARVAAEVTPADGSSAAGTVTFTYGTDVITAVPVTDGVAHATLPQVFVGTHAVRAEFTPDSGSHYATADGSTSVTSVAVGTTVALQAPTTAVVGAETTITASVASAVSSDTRTPRGTITFEIAGASVAGLETSPGVFVATYVPARIGNDTVHASFAPTDVAEYSASTSTDATVDVTGIPVTLAGELTPTELPGGAQGTLIVTATAPDSTPEQTSPPQATRMRVMQAPVTRTVTGSVQLVIDGTPIAATAVLSGGVARLSVPAGLPAGDHTASAIFTDPDGVFASATLTPIPFTVRAGVDDGGTDDGGTNTDDGTGTDDGKDDVDSSVGSGGSPTGTTGSTNISAPGSNNDSTSGSSAGSSRSDDASLAATGTTAPVGLALIALLAIIAGAGMRRGRRHA